MVVLRRRRERQSKVERDKPHGAYIRPFGRKDEAKVLEMTSRLVAVLFATVATAAEAQYVATSTNGVPYPALTLASPLVL